MSDRKTSVDELKAWIRAFCDERKWGSYHTPKDVAIGLVTEASELLEEFRFLSESDQATKVKFNNQGLKDELADSLFFILRASDLWGIDLTEALRQKMEKNAKKYPIPLVEKN